MNLDPKHGLSVKLFLANNFLLLLLAGVDEGGTEESSASWQSRR